MLMTMMVVMMMVMMMNMNVCITPVCTQTEGLCVGLCVCARLMQPHRKLLHAFTGSTIFFQVSSHGVYDVCVQKDKKAGTVRAHAW